MVASHLDRVISPEARKIAILAAAITGVLIVGVAGFAAIEGMGFLDALYMTVITLSTVGFKEVKSLSPAGRLFTIFLIAGGVSVIAYGVGTLIDFIVGGQLTGMFRRRALRRQIEELRNHYIICGFGRVGETVAREFARASARFVVIDSNQEVFERVVEESFLAVCGDASDDEVLLEAGIRRARGLITAVDSDADNMFVTLSARGLNPQLFIVARANSDESVNKLRRAGADQVISPYAIGGKRMATLMLKPLVSDYLDVVTGGGELEFRLEEFELNTTCDVVGKSIRELEVRKRTGATILAVRHHETGQFDTNPAPELVLRDGDVLIAIGTPGEMASLEELFACRVPSSMRERYDVAD